ncbi:hypothetical protein LIER_42144 [Lithospermum erythrorhizon]|uniref:Endonuclease/exonuclease/phosphatase domain-containing protein n=1 Tax=Lithospermum erythrorhizon TaxID=34254 RepID=A0AAV3RR20_LITER
MSLLLKMNKPNALIVESDGRKGGLVLMWGRDVEVEVLSFSTHHIEAIIVEAELPPWGLIGFYGHHEVHNRKFSWNLMRFLNNTSQLPTLFIGDFNEVTCNNEHNSHMRSRPTWQMDNFIQSIQDCNLADIGFSGFPFTWCNNFISPFSTRARLDRGLASRDWTSCFRDAELVHLSSNRLNHLPLLLNLGKGQIRLTKTKPRFCFEERQQVFSAIQNCRLGFLNWKRNVLGDVQVRIDNKQVELDMLNQGTITDQSKRKTIGLAKDIDRSREANDTYWRQRSRVEWQVKGDMNTSFFHDISAQRGKANLITALQKEDGEWVRDH